VILGGGFGGLSAALQLRRAPVEVTLIDRCNYHLFQPLLYQVATGSLSPANVSSPLRTILKRQRNTQVLLAEAVGIDAAKRRVILSDGAIDYDTLIVATGSSHQYFGHDEWEQWAPGLKTVEDATDMRRRILLAFEMAERETDPEKRHAMMTFVIVGGGPTGVEKFVGPSGHRAGRPRTHSVAAANPFDPSERVGQENLGCDGHRRERDGRFADHHPVVSKQVDHVAPGKAGEDRSVRRRRQHGRVDDHEEVRTRGLENLVSVDEQQDVIADGARSLVEP